MFVIANFDTLMLILDIINSVKPDEKPLLTIMISEIEGSLRNRFIINSDLKDSIPEREYKRFMKILIGVSTALALTIKAIQLKDKESLDFLDEIGELMIDAIKRYNLIDQMDENIRKILEE
jgi:hypothetical protein